MDYISPLNIYVVWHPDFKEGEEFAKHIYSTFTRDIEKPLSRGLNIPVFFRYKAVRSGFPIPIVIDDTIERSMIIALIDDNCLLYQKAYIEEIFQISENLEIDKKDRHRFIPVAISKDAHRISPVIGRENFINLYAFDFLETQKEELIVRITHELCRLVYQRPRISEIEFKAFGGEKLHLFLSYARADGIPITEEIDTYFSSKTPLNTFFDKNDIPPGYKFDNVIDENLKKSTLLIIQTNAYSSREWCRWEVLRAKKYNRPILIVHAISDKEERSFPYLGNVPVIIYSKNKSHAIFQAILLETLRYEHAKLLIENKAKEIGKDLGTIKILGSAPELYTLLDSKSKKIKEVIYPDPPLTHEELELLNELDEFEFSTPTTLFN